MNECDPASAPVDPTPTCSLAAPRPQRRSACHCRLAPSTLPLHPDRPRSAPRPTTTKGNP